MEIGQISAWSSTTGCENRSDNEDDSSMKKNEGNQKSDRKSDKEMRQGHSSDVESCDDNKSSDSEGSDRYQDQGRDIVLDDIYYSFGFTVGSLYRELGRAADMYTEARDYALGLFNQQMDRPDEDGEDSDEDEEDGDDYRREEKHRKRRSRKSKVAAYNVERVASDVLAKVLKDRDDLILSQALEIQRLRSETSLGANGSMSNESQRRHSKQDMHGSSNRSLSSIGSFQSIRSSVSGIKSLLKKKKKKNLVGSTVVVSARETNEMYMPNQYQSEYSSEFDIEIPRKRESNKDMLSTQARALLGAAPNSKNSRNEIGRLSKKLKGKGKNNGDEASISTLENPEIEVCMYKREPWQRAEI